MEYSVEPSGAKTETPLYIPLAVTPTWRKIYVANTVVCLLFALAGFGILFTAKDVRDLGQAALTIIFFGGGGLMILRILSRRPGRIEVGPEGLFIQCYFTVGMADWGNLAQVAAVKVLGVPYLGIKLENAEKYLASRKLLQDQNSIRDVELVSFAARVLFTMAKIPLLKQTMGLIFSVLGFSALPETLREIDLMEYNAKNFGYHIIFPVFLLAAKPAQIAEQLQVALDQARQSTASAPPPSEQKAPAGPDEKECPMCAETVKARAKICRFCGYKFEGT